jgi:hypothetical protein
MASIGLIACTKSKSAKTSPAALLYQSPLFRKSLLYSLGHSDRTYILSAKHGVLQLDDLIEPYEVSMKHLNSAQRAEWAVKVSLKLTELIKPGDIVHLLAGLDYSRPLLPTLQRIGCKVTSPLSGKSLGHRISWLRLENREPDLLLQFSKFYACMRDLYVGQQGGRILGEATGKMAWPSRGVYFLLEPNENLAMSKFRPLEKRVTRIGTHAVSRGSKATLWNRLSTHRGVIAGSGNHRSSIFRLHVGAALMRKEKDGWNLPSWGVGQVSDVISKEVEDVLERRVSDILGRMRVLWLDVPDDPSPYSDRSYLERNAIGLLSRVGILTRAQTSNWLGNWSKHIQISLSGIWNLNHLYAVPDDEFTDVLSRYVAITLGKMERPTQSLAPVAWYGKHQATDSPQLSLFADDSQKSAADNKRSA